jgi:two-component system chemotaxis response regulator CheB
MARAELIVVGASWGGLKALSTLLAGLPRDLDAAVVVAQHRAPRSTDALAGLLQQHGAIPVCEVEDKMAIAAGNVYLAPPDYHVLVEREKGGKGRLSLSLDARVQFSRPSVDVLFESAAAAYQDRVAAVVLTGANADGAAGLRAVKDAGGFTIVQDPDTAESRVMPEAAIASGAADKVLPLSQIAAFLVDLCRTA